MVSNVTTHPKALLLNKALEAVRARSDLRTALRWTQAANPELGGRSPVQAIRDGDEELVLRLANAS
jgi:hypothetical protein